MFKKNTAVTGFIVGLVSATDGSDITTGTPVGYYTLDGGTQTAISDVTPVHEGNGQWSFDLLAAEMNGDIVGLTFTHASAITAHFTIKTDTKIVSDLSDPSAAAIRTEMDSNSTQFAAIVADTNELQTDWANGGRLDLLIDAILADTGTDGVVISAATANKIADHIIRRSFATAAASADGDTKSFRSLLGAVAKLVNKVSISGSTLSIFEADDTTSLGSQTLTTDATADPITGADTV